MEKLKGKGGLEKCPSCKSANITLSECNPVGFDIEIHRVDCNKCGKHFTETWKAVDWEEVSLTCSVSKK